MVEDFSLPENTLLANFSSFTLPSSLEEKLQPCSFRGPRVRIFYIFLSTGVTDKFIDIVKAHSGGNYILKLRHSHALISNDSDAKQPEPKGDYTFDKIHFRYPLRKNVPVLQGLDLKVANHERPIEETS